jgi:hypothetical protein
MRSRRKITRVQLKVPANAEYSLLGIVTTEPDYKLSLSLNEQLKISLKNNSPIEIIGANGAHLNFSKFSDVKEAPDVIYTLISNKSDKDFLVKKLNKIDYFFQVHSPERDYNIDHLTTSLRGIESITAVFSINPGEIKDKNLHYLIP